MGCFWFSSARCVIPYGIIVALFRRAIDLSFNCYNCFRITSHFHFLEHQNSCINLETGFSVWRISSHRPPTGVSPLDWRPSDPRCATPKYAAVGYSLSYTGQKVHLALTLSSLPLLFRPATAANSNSLTDDTDAAAAAATAEDFNSSSSSSLATPDDTIRLP